MAHAEAARILVTRSQPGANVLAAALQAAGYRAEVVPLLGVQPHLDPGADVLLRSLDRFDALVFTSAHAVEHFAALLATRGLDWPRCARFVAVGAATAAALAEHAIRADTPIVAPVDERSEGILDLPIPAFDDGAVLIVGGEGGRRELDRGLAARGARVSRIAVYRRIGLDAAVRSIDARRYDAAVVSSVAGGEALAALARGASAGEVLRLQLIVPSQRVAQALRAMGFVRLTVSEGAAPTAVIRALKSLDEAKHGD